MRNKRRYKKKAIDDTWSIFLKVIYISLFFIVLGFGYLLLESPINSYVNRKVLTPAELVLFHKNAEIRRNLQRKDDDWDRIENGIHVRTGLYADDNLDLVIGTCTSCHSSKLIAQNKATRVGWKNMIKWMQETQGLADLGKSEPIVLDYLAKYYAPKDTGRRKNLDKIKWYVLDLSKEM